MNKLFNGKLFTAEAIDDFQKHASLVHSLRVLTGHRVTCRSHFSVEHNHFHLVVTFPDDTILDCYYFFNDDPLEVFKSVYPEYCI